MKNNLLDTDLQWIVRRTAENLHLTEREVAGLEKYLWKNYLRDICALEAFVSGVDDIGPRVLHPVMFEALREAAAMRREISDVQSRPDRLEKIVTPHFFRHSPIYVHRLWKPDGAGSGSADQYDYGVIIQTAALDVSDELPLSVFREVVSCQLQIPLSVLFLFCCAAPARTEVYDYDKNSAPVAERMDWESSGGSLQKLHRRMVPLPASDHTLKDLRIGPGSEVFCLSLAPLDLDTLCIEGLKRAWAGDANLFSQLDRVPIPFIDNPRASALPLIPETQQRPVAVVTEGGIQAECSREDAMGRTHSQCKQQRHRSVEAPKPASPRRHHSKPHEGGWKRAASQQREYYHPIPEHRGYRGDEEIHFCNPADARYYQAAYVNGSLPRIVSQPPSGQYYA